MFYHKNASQWHFTHVNPKQFSNYAKALGVEVKNDIEDARVLSKALTLAKEGEVKVPVFNEDVE